MELRNGWVEVLSEPGESPNIQELGRAMFKRWLKERDVTPEDVQWHLVRIMYERAADTEGVRVLLHLDEFDRLGIDADDFLRESPP